MMAVYRWLQEPVEEMICKRLVVLINSCLEVHVSNSDGTDLMRLASGCLQYEACDRPYLKAVVSGLASLQKYASEMFYPCNFSCSNSYTFCICWEHRLVMCAIHFNLVFLLMSSSMFPCLIVLTEFRCRLLRTLCWASNMIKVAQTKSCYLLSVKLLPESRDIEGWWL